jgi:hypothetical protein
VGRERDLEVKRRVGSTLVKARNNMILVYTNEKE